MARKSARTSKSTTRKKSAAKPRAAAGKRSPSKPRAKAKATSSKSKATAKKAAVARPAKKSTPRRPVGKAVAKKPVAKKPVGKSAVRKKAIAKKAVAKKSTERPAAKRESVKSTVATPKVKQSAKPARQPVMPSPEALKPAAVPVRAKSAEPVAAAKPKPTPTKAPLPRGAGREVIRVGEAPVPASRPSFAAEFLERQRAKLLAKKEEILAMYRKDLQNGQESNDSPTEDLVDRANNAYSRELAFSISDNERELLLQIDQALARVAGGTYGYCLHTGLAIALPRLEALPWAKYSVEAQEMLEKGLLTEA